MTKDALPTGFVGRTAIRLILLFIVLSEITFLGSRYRVRGDMTADGLYTLTESTQKVLSRLEDRLIIEAYFTPKQSLPILDQSKRAALVNLLEEYEKLSGGKLRVQFIDPLENKTQRETAERLGMTPRMAEDRSGRGVTRMDIWQGLRLRYGGRKQEIIPYMPFPPRGRHSTAFYERVLTPLIKRLTMTERPKIGVLAFRSRPGGRGLSFSAEERTPPQGFNHLMRIFGREYDLRPIDITKGQLIPEDIQIAFLVRPKYLSDRTKFVFDQFLMRGGKLVIFADTCEMEIRRDRAFRGTVVPFDAAPAKWRFEDMLKTYGVEVRNQIVGDGVPGVQQLFYDARQDRKTGQARANPILYPFMFEAANDDWHKLVESMARDSSGKVDPVLAEQYKQKVQPGMAKDHELIKLILVMGAPGMFWPCPVELMKTLPVGITGEVLLRTSPLSWVEPPNMLPIDPFDEAPDFQQREQSLRRWSISKQNMRPATPRQFSLMVHLEGEFTSFFADKDIPISPVAAAAAAAKKKKKEDEDWGDQKKPEKKPAGKDEALPKPAKVEATPQVEESKLSKGSKSGTLVVIGDATFIRDDFIAGVYQQPDSSHMLPLYGPLDRQGGRAQLFVKNLLDWLAGERDLGALQNKRPIDRMMKFIERDVAKQETEEEFRERLISRASLLRLTNVLGPVSILLLLGIGIWLTRRAKKRAFLARW